MGFRRDLPNLNTGTPWSETDDQDLRACFSKRKPVTHKAVIEAATFLCRNGEEVRARLRELGYIRPRAEAARFGRRKSNCRSRLAQQVRQLGDVRSYSTRFVPREPFGCHSALRFVIPIHIRKRLTCRVTDDEAFDVVFNGPRRREAAFGHWRTIPQRRVTGIFEVPLPLRYPNDF